MKFNKGLGNGKLIRFTVGMNKKTFQVLLKSLIFKIEDLQISTGRLFQSLVAVTAKKRPPSVSRLWRGQQSEISP